MLRIVSPWALPLLFLTLTQAACQAKPDNTPGKVDYWAMVAPLVSGQFGGDCILPGKDKLAKGSFTVASDGKVDAAGELADFKLAERLNLEWINRGGSGSMMAAALIGEATVKVGTYLARNETMASLKRGTTIVQCDSSKLAAPLAAARPHLLAAKLLASPPREIVCSPRSEDGPASVKYAYKEGVLTLNGEAIRLANLESETLSFEENFKDMSYTAFMAGHRSVSVTFDSNGKMTKLEIPAGPGAIATCNVK